MFILLRGLFRFKNVLSFLIALWLPLMTVLGVRMPGVNVESGVSGCLYPATKKVRKVQLIGEDKSISFGLAKGEREACQLVLRANKISNDLVWEMTPFQDKDGNVLESKVFKEAYISVAVADEIKNFPEGTIPRSMPDALMPFEGGPFSLMIVNENQPFYIQVTSTLNTMPGEYKSVVTVKDGDELQERFEITAKVWGFTLPETPTCETAFGLSKGCIAQKHGVAANSAEATELYKKYYEYLLSHKISAYSIPVDILSDEADAYLNDPRMTSFCIPYSGNDETLQRYYNKVSSNPEWAAKGYFYPIDEPTSAEHYRTYEAMTDRLNSLCPGYNMVTPFYKYKFTDEDIQFNSLQMQRGRSNIICGISNLHEFVSTEKYPSKTGFREDLEARVREGDKSWWYVCCGPRPDYCNFFTSNEGLETRLLFWQQKQRNVGGVLYWDTTYWWDVEDVWSESLTTPWTGAYAFGDGSLFYNGNKIGINGPVSSLRLETVADGIEDFEYLTIAEKIFGRDYIDKLMAKLTTGLKEYTYSDDLFIQVRETIGNDIDEYCQNQ